MKIDYDLIRKILLKREESEDPVDYNFSIDGYTPKQFAYHGNLLKERGYFSDFKVSYADNEIYLIGVGQVTWAGIDFLDSIREENVWYGVKNTIKEKALSWTFDTIKEIGIQVNANLVSSAFLPK